MDLKMSFWKKIQRKIMQLYTGNPDVFSHRPRQKFNWLDAHHALTEVRNSLVHPEHKKRGQLDSAYYEAWNLSLWYLEMGLLAVCKYSGTYGNRLKQRLVGQVEKVPWSSL